MFGEAEQTTAGVGGQREASGTQLVLVVLGIACTCGTWSNARKTLRVRLQHSSRDVPAPCSAVLNTLCSQLPQARPDPSAHVSWAPSKLELPANPPFISVAESSGQAGFV